MAEKEVAPTHKERSAEPIASNLNQWFKAGIKAGIKGAANTYAGRGGRVAKQARREGGCDGCAHTPPQTAEVHFFVKKNK